MSTAQPSLFASVAQREELERQTDIFIAQATATIVHARSIVQADDRSLASMLVADRDALCELLGRYQRFKHGAVFNPVIQRGITSSAIVARSLKAECVLMGEAFGNYCARWAHADLPAVWPSYRREMLEITARLLDHLRTERDAIAKLLALSTLYQRPDPATARQRPSTIPAIAAVAS